jgi:hypothetical protein
MIQRASVSSPRAGGCFGLAEPSHDGTALIFWDPALRDHVVRLAPARPDIEAPRILFDPSRWPGRTAMRVVGTALHLIVRTASADHHLWLRQAEPPTIGTPLEVHLDLTADLPAQIHDLTDLYEAFTVVPVRRRSSRRTAPRGMPTAQRAQLLMRTLRALDADLAGASDRQIAEALVGAARVAAEWSRVSPLRQPVRDLLERGRYYLRGGYRDLLKSARRRHAA